MLIERNSSLDAARDLRVDALHGAEEFTLGATIDERTTVFNLGRTTFVFLGEPGAFRGSPT